MTTAAPSSAKRSHVSRPMPAPPPVMIATLFLRRFIVRHPKGPQLGLVRGVDYPTNLPPPKDDGNRSFMANPVVVWVGGQLFNLYCVDDCNDISSIGGCVRGGRNDLSFVVPRSELMTKKIVSAFETLE